MSLSTSAQEQGHEIGLRMSGLNDFGFVYKKQLDSDRFQRHRLADLGFRSSHMNSGDQYNLSLGYRYGLERRRSLDPRLSFIHGPELGMSIFGIYSVNRSAERFTSGQVQVGPVIGYVLGFQYDVSESFYVSLETIPSAQAFFTIDGNGLQNTNTWIGFNSDAIALTLAYSFISEKKKG